MKCPKCRKQEMESETYEGVEVERCPACKGLYLDRGELLKLIREEQGNVADKLKFSPTSDMMDALPAHCPRCEQDMIAAAAPGGVSVNLCQRCAAIFLDQGELATIQLHAQQA